MSMDLSTLGSWWPFAAILVGWATYRFLTWNHDYWKKRGVPYVNPLPFFGNVKDSFFFKKAIGEVHQDIYWKLDGHKYGGLFNLSRPTLLVRDPEVIKDVLVRDFTSFHDNEIQINTDADPMIGRNPFVLRGDRWKITRARLMPAFTVAKLRPLFPLVEEVCQELKGLLSQQDNSGEFDTKEVCARFTTDVVATCAFGVHGHSIKDPNSEFRRMGRAIINPGFFSNLKFMVAFLAPTISQLFGFRFVPQHVEDFFTNLVKDVTNYREKENVSRNDYMQHLMSVKKKTAESPSEEYPFSDIDLAAQAVTFFIDGFETSSTVLSFTLYSLAINPDIQVKVREEVNSVIQENGGEFTYDIIQKMTYLDMVLSESLRMYPPVMFMTRSCSRPFNLPKPSGGHVTIEVDTPVIIPVYALHHDPKHFPNPEVFDPERFSEENKKEHHKYAYLPFGEGPRICLGFRFAQMQVKACLAAIVTNFDLSPTDRTPIPIVPDPSNFLLGIKGGLWIRFRLLSDLNN